MSADSARDGSMLWIGIHGGNGFCAMDARDLELAENMLRDADRWVVMASELGLDMDFTAASIERLESAVPRIQALGRSTSGSDNGQYDNFIAGATALWAAYVGECLCRNGGGRWILEEYGPGIHFSDRFKAYPENKIRKRLCGDETDSIASFYSIVVDADMRQRLLSPSIDTIEYRSGGE